MNAPEKLPASAEPHVMKTYGRLPIALSHGRGCWLWDTEGKKYLDGLGRHRRQHARPRPPQAGAGAARPGRQADPQLELLPRAAAGAARRQAVRALGPDQRLLLQLGPRGQRGGAQDRAQVRPRQGHRAPGDRRLRERPSTAARSPPSRPPATPRSRPASARWSRASCACRSTTSRRSRRSRATNPNVVAVFLEVIQGEGGIRPTTRRPTSRKCAASATSAAGC